MKKEKILPEIKLKYYQKEKDGSSPKHDDLECYICRKRGIAIGSAYQTEKGEPKFICEDCTIDQYRERHGYKSRKAAAARRRRMFDVGYLFNEMIVDKYLKKKYYKSVDDLSEEEMEHLFNVGRNAYNDLFSKKEKIKLEEIEKQENIEEKLLKNLKKVEV